MMGIKEYDSYEKKDSDDDFYKIGRNLNPSILIPIVSWESKGIPCKA